VSDHDGGVTPGERSDERAVAAAPTEPFAIEAGTESEIPGGTIGRYEIRRVVASGGMGVVLAARDPELGRDVAIKILAREHEEARTRLLREAQAMAKLSHAHVVTVHEVLKVGDRAAIVMELVDGRDLAAWLDEAPRGWREIVAAFVQAARGLAAAHKAGMVHRDFKPSNALIDRDGVVRVTDFGLVRAGAADDAVGGDDRASTDRLDLVLTRTGALIGTPAYMAPEQHAGEAVDARTDQWALACALYGALYRQRPFAGETYAELAASVTGGKLRPEPKATDVPRRIRVAIRRALARDPADRFATMDELIAALTPPRRAWVAAGVAGTVAIAAAITAVAVTGDDDVTCEGLDAPFAATWNADRARAVRDQFDKSGVGFAADAADRVAASIERYRNGWVAMRTRACTEARRGTGSPDLLDRRMRCLDLRLVEIDTLVDALVVADAKLVGTATGVVARLPSVDDCANPIDTMPRPTDPSARAAIARAEADVAAAFTLENIGRFDEARVLAEGAIKVSEDTGWTPLAAKALLELAKWQSRIGDSDAAVVTFDRAAEAAARAANDELFADALIRKFWVVSSELNRPDEAFASKPYIELAILRAGSTPRLRATWLAMLASGLNEQKKHQEALDTQLEATALWRQIDPDNMALSDSLNNEAAYRMRLGQLDEAKAIFEKLLETDTVKFGSNHPELARRHYNLANIALMRDDPDTAIVHFENAYEIRKAAGFVDWTGAYALGENYYKLGRWVASHPKFVEALEILERTQKGSQYVFGSQMAIGIVMTELGRLDEARSWLAKALAGAQAAKSPLADHIADLYGPVELAAGDLPAARRVVADSRAASKASDSPVSTMALLVDAEIALREKSYARAKAGFDEVAKRGKEEGEEPIVATQVIVGLAERALAAGTPAEKQAARDAVEERLTWALARKPDPGAVAPLRFALARALVATGGDRARARSLAEAARDGFATLGDPGKKRADGVARWLAGTR
jgi:tetratricopeptide (TPR) repeat protein/tRNA A-37 threonylcarbamoyl transferase component Bud32